MRAVIYRPEDGRITQIMSASQAMVQKTANVLEQSWLDAPDAPDDADSRFHVVDDQLVEIA